MIYNTNEPAPISTITPYCDSEHSRVRETPFTSLPEWISKSHSSWYHSQAGLDHVHRVKLFYDVSTTFCQGILLEYDDGAQRALGQCRLRVDPSWTYAKPSFICFSNRAVKDSDDDGDIRAVEIRFGEGSEHTHRREGWEYFQMVGTLHFLFASFQARVYVSDGVQILPPSNSHSIQAA